MSTTETRIPDDEPVIVMTRTYDAPRALVWEAFTEPRHVREWWGGPGTTNPVCEMDVRPGGAWKHVMRFPDGKELAMAFTFVEVDPPGRLVWKGEGDSPAPVTTVELEDVGGRTRWTMTARFASIAARNAAREYGYTRPIAASSDRLVAYLPTMKRG